MVFEVDAMDPTTTTTLMRASVIVLLNYEIIKSLLILNFTLHYLIYNVNAPIAHHVGSCNLVPLSGWLINQLFMNNAAG